MAEQLQAETVDTTEQTMCVEALHQVADLLHRAYGLEIRPSSGGTAFETEVPPAPRTGVLAAQGQLTENAVLAVDLELARAAAGARIAACDLLAGLSKLDEKCRLLEPAVNAQTGEMSVRIQLRAHAAPMSMTREAAFLAELEKLDAIARDLQSSLPQRMDHSALAKLYEKVAEHLEPVHPLDLCLADLDKPLADWARAALDFAQGHASLALSAPQAVVEHYALAALSLVAREYDMTLGRLLPPSISTKSLAELAKKAPGLAVIPAVRISMGTSPYELNQEVSSLLVALTHAGTPVVFTGTQEQLQAVFGGGQGGAAEPLQPVVLHPPEIELDALVRFAVRTAASQAGGLSSAASDRVTKHVAEALMRVTPSSQRRVLPMLAARLVREASRGAKGAAVSAPAYAECITAQTETLAGLSPRPRGARRAEVQQNFLRVLSDPALAGHLQEQLLGQDRALDELAARLRTECLTRPLHQPLRYCAQGTPATGKSESAALVAARLEIPYINVDAASMPDYYSAAAQLLGSGRGIVGSYQSGRLEQAAKYHRGALIEVSDLDHAVPAVRSALADLFLQILETGEGQSATGVMFSCANLVFAFTMNLPDGLDETVRRSIGFLDTLTHRDITRQVSTHIKQMLSGAFLSRVGTPILFEPLDGSALAAILERTMRAALLAAADRLQLRVADVTVEPGTGAALLASLPASVTAFGARALLEHGRCLAAQAFLQLPAEGATLAGRRLRARHDAPGALRLEID